MDTDEQGVLDEEAVAEEEFVADVEETVKNNPLVHKDEAIGSQTMVEPANEGETLAGAIGTGGLTPEEKPFNNEEAFRSESVNNDENPFNVGSSAGGSFGGPDTAPLGDAAETIAPAAAQEGAFDTTTFSAGATAEAAAPVAASEPTIADLAQGAAAAPATPANEATPVAATTAPVSAAEPKPKKKKTGLIIAIVVILLLIAAAVAGVIFYNIHESKENILGDALSGIWLADARQLDGKITVTPGGESDGYEAMTIDFKADNNSANFSGSGSIAIEFTDGKKTSLDISGAYISKDGIYVQFDKLESAIDKIDFTSIFGGYGTEMAPYGTLIKDTLKDVAKEIDGNWYKINGDSFESYKQYDKDAYDCVTKALDELSESSAKEEISEAYKKHPFVVVDDKDPESADDLTYYSIKFNEEERKAFDKDASEIEAVKTMKSCINTEKDSDTTTDDDGESNMTIKLGIKGWSHELRAIKGNMTTDDGSTLDFNMKIGYEDKSVAAPTSDAKNIIDAGEDLQKVAIQAFKKHYPKFAQEMCEQQYGSSGSVYVQICREQLERKMDDALEGIIDEVGGGIITTSVGLKK